MKRLLIILTVIIYALTSNAVETSQTIRGTILDKDSKIPIIGATVIIVGSDPLIGTVTDLDGNFRLENINLGRQSLKISFVGYDDAFINNILLNVGKEAVLNIELEEKVIAMDEVVVKAFGKKDETINEMAMVSARSFTIEETERFAGSLGDPARMVANYAGVMTQNDSRNDIIIRGNSPIGVLWSLDGIEIPNPNHFGALGTTGGPVSMINNNLLTNSDFLTGAFPAEYGNAISGAFDLNLRTGNNEKREYVGQIGFNGFEFGAEGPISKDKRSSYLINYRYSTLAVFHHLGFGTGTGSAVPYYQDLSFKFDFPKTKLGRFSLIGLGGKSNITMKPDTTAEDGNAYNATFTNTYYASDLGVVGLSHLIFFNDNTRLKSSVSIQGTKNTTEVDSVKDVRNDISVPYYRSHYFDGKVSVSSTLKSKVNAKNNFSVGVTYDLYIAEYTDSAFIRNIYMPVEDANGNIMMEKVNGFINLTDGNGDFPLLKGFAQWQHKFTDNITAYGGLYSQYFNYTNEIVVEPRIAAEWEFTKGQSINIGFGKHSMIQPRQVYFQQYYDTLSGKYWNSNDYIEFTKSDHYVVGYNNLISSDFRFKAEAYYQNLYNIPVHKDDETYSMVNQGDFFAIITPDSMINEGTGRNIGIELTLEKFLSKGYYFLLTSSIFDSKYTGYDGVERNTAFNGNYVFNALGGYEKKVGEHNLITFDVKAVWAGGKRYIPYKNNIYELAALGENINPEDKISLDDVDLDYSKSYENKYSDYFRVDIRIGFKKNGKRATQEWALDLQNITNYQSIFQEQYDPEKNEIVQTPQQGFYPMMLYRIQF